MIIRKPYAFLIKNFKKIHIALLILSLYVVYKLFDVNSYVGEFMRLGTYDRFGDPITKHITFWLRLSIFLLTSVNIFINSFSCDSIFISSIPIEAFFNLSFFELQHPIIVYLNLF